MTRIFTMLGAVSALVAVATGAFGVHGLPKYFAELYDKPEVAERMLRNWETAARYEMYHALGMLAVAWACSRFTSANKLLSNSGWCFLAGTILFSGSLYVLCLTGQFWLGMITPIGGVAFMTGWLLLAIAAYKQPAGT